MASYHFAIKTSKQCAAQSNIHYLYISREGAYSKGKKAEELVHKQNGNMPKWAENKPEDFWKAADQYEQVNGTTYREIELALPIELNKEKQIELVETFVDKYFGKDFVYSYAIHSNDARLAKNIEKAYNENGEYVPEKVVPIRNPHVHIMFCERKLDNFERSKELFFRRANSKKPELGGAKKDNRWNGKQRNSHLKVMREDWAIMQNEALARAGYPEIRVDHRSLDDQRKEALAAGDISKAQELDREPEKHLGPKIVAFPVSVNTDQRENDKVRYIMLSREYKKLLEQVKKKQLEVALLKARNQKLNEETKISPFEAKKNANEVNLTIAEIRELCNKRIKEIDGVMRLKRMDHVDVLGKALSQERARVIALSVYFKGANKQVNIDARKIRDEVKIFEQKRKEFLAKPKPGIFQLSYKLKYQEEADTLAKWQDDLTKRKMENDRKLNYFAEEAKKPDVKLKIDKIQERILAKNQPYQIKAANIKAQLEGLKFERDRFIELKQEVGKLYEKAPSVITVSPPRGQPMTPDDILDQVRKIADTIAVDKTRNVGLRAKIYDDDDNENNKRRRRGL